MGVGNVSDVWLAVGEEWSERYLSLNAFSIRSTSISRLKAVASLLSSLSMSSTAPGALEEVTLEDDAVPDMAKIEARFELSFVLWLLMKDGGHVKEGTGRGLAGGKGCLSAFGFLARHHRHSGPCHNAPVHYGISLPTGLTPGPVAPKPLEVEYYTSHPNSRVSINRRMG